jgi:hypothetical protein
VRRCFRARRSASRLTPRLRRRASLGLGARPFFLVSSRRAVPRQGRSQARVAVGDDPLGRVTLDPERPSVRFAGDRGLWGGVWVVPWWCLAAGVLGGVGLGGLPWVLLFRRVCCRSFCGWLLWRSRAAVAHRG